MVSSRAYPGLERKPGGPDNWVEVAGGLPTYIERIAKHLHYEKGFTISHAIATAVNTVKRWARKGGVVKYNDPNNKHVTTITAAQAAKAVAEWEAKKAMARGRGGRRGRVSLSVDATEVTVDLSALATRANAIEDPVARGKARLRVLELAVGSKCTYCDDPATKSLVKTKGGVITTCAAHQAAARQRISQEGDTVKAVNDLSVPAFIRHKKPTLPGDSNESFPIETVADLRKAILAYGRAKDKAKAKAWIIKRAKELGATGSLPKGWADGSTGGGSSSGPKARRGSAELDDGSSAALLFSYPMTKDGRRSYKNRGKWKHGFIPVDSEAVTSKAKGSPIAKRRIERLYPGGNHASGSDTAARRSGGKGKPKASRGIVISRSKSGATERAGDVGQLRNTPLVKTHRTQRIKSGQQEASRGRRTARAVKPWNEIPETEKTIRNGRRYTLTTYHGKTMLTEWTGPTSRQEGTDPYKRKLRTIQASQAANMTTAQIRRLLRVPGQSAAVKAVLNKVLRQKIKKGKGSA